MSNIPANIVRRPLPYHTDLVGIMNSTGTMCFLNSVIQGLLSNRVFVEWLMSYPKSSERDLISVLYDIQTTMNDLRKRRSDWLQNRVITRERLSPYAMDYMRIDVSEIVEVIRPLLDRYGIRIDRPDDAHLTLMSMIEDLIREEPELRPMFESIIHIEQYCTNCGYRSDRVDKVHDIQLSWSEHVSTLDDILDDYLDPMRIPNTCPQCGLQNVIDERRDFDQLAEILIITLLGRYSDQGHKLPDVIDYPGRMRMDTNDIFDLNAVIDLHQTTVQCGHYNIIIKSGSHWWRIDDSVIMAIAPSQIQSPSNYILIYNKIDGS